MKMTNLEKFRIKHARTMVFELIEYFRKHPNPNPAFLDGLVIQFRDVFHFVLNGPKK